MSTFLKKILIFVKKDFLQERAPTDILEIVFSVIARIFILYFIFKSFSLVNKAVWLSSKVSYFNYIYIGLIYISNSILVVISVSETIYKEQLRGTLEMLFTTPTNFFNLLMYTFFVYVFEISFFTLPLFYLFSRYFLKLDINLFGIHYFSLLTVILVTMLFLFSLILMGAGYVIYFKRNLNSGLFAIYTSSILTGVFFPVQILPEPFQRISYFIPLTHGLKFLRAILFQNANIGWKEMTPFLTETLIFFALGILIYIYAEKKGIREGTLGHN